VPLITAAILKRQGYECPICRLPVGARTRKSPALDHDHGTGYIRGVLCANCNGIEGKIHNLARRVGTHTDRRTVLERLIAYWDTHSTPQWGGILHHTHKTEDEKRLERAKKAAIRRKKAKEQK
jgi:hypothetical protein